jgi:flagellar assembly protein FliH
MTSLYRLIRGAPEPTDSYPVLTEMDLPGQARANRTASDPDEQTGETGEMEQAYQSGYQAGYTACIEANRADIEKQVAAFTSMADDLVAQRKRLVRESEVAVIRLSCEVARKIVGEAADTNETVASDIVKEALEHLVDKQKVTIRVNPEDVAVLKRNQSEWLAAANSTGSVKILEDARIRRGGCLVEGDSGNVEAQIDRQVEVIEKALVEAAK